MSRKHTATVKGDGRQRFNITMARDTRTVAEELAKQDVRPSISNLVEWLILKERERRAMPCEKEAA